MSPMRNFVRDFAIINSGGKGVVLIRRQADLSKAIMLRDDFEFLHRNEWVETTRSDGTVLTIHPEVLEEASQRHAGLIMAASFLSLLAPSLQASAISIVGC